MKIILIGDSITSQFDTQKHLPEFNIINAGIYGDNTTGILARLWQDIISESPDKVFLLIGINDIALERTNEEIIENISAISKKINNELKLTKLYLTSILPTRNLENRSNVRIKELNIKIKNIAEENGNNYYDLFSIMLDESGELKENYTKDGLHLTEDAYIVWAEDLKKLINKTSHLYN